MQLVANLSLMFTELPMLDRLGAAKRAGFDFVEIQFPYEWETGELVAARDEADVGLVLINLLPGDRDRGEAGLMALPGREEDFREAVERGVEYASALGAKLINSLAGKPGDVPRDEAVATARANLAHAADRFAKIGATVLVEPVNPTDVPGFLLPRLADAMKLAKSAGRENVKVLFDLYHMQQTEPSLTDAIREAAPTIGHVQFADTPGRHEPGTGVIDFDAALRTLREVGYDDYLSAEYRSEIPTAESLGWMDRFRSFM